MLKLTHLRNFVAIAETGSIRAAARKLGLAQPALTRSLSELEGLLQARLFERQARGMQPTPVGLALLHRARRVLTETQRAAEEARQLAGGDGGHVTAGLSVAVHLAALPSGLRQFHRRYPAVQLQILEGLYPTLEEGLRDGRIDFYIGPNHGEPVAPELLMQEISWIRRVILCRRDHPLAGARSLHDLVGAEWMTTSVATGEEAAIVSLFTDRGLPPPRIAMRVRSALSIGIGIAETDLLAIVPEHWLRFSPANDRLTHLEVAEPLPMPRMVLIRNARFPLTPAAQTFADLLQAALQRDHDALAPPEE